MTIASEKQINFIKKLLDEKYFTELDAAGVAYDIKSRSGKTRDAYIDLDDLESLTSLEASKLISALLEAPSKAKIAKEAERRDAAFVKHAELVKWAKDHGVKITTRTRAAVIRGKILDASLEIPAEFAGEIKRK